MRLTPEYIAAHQAKHFPPAKSDSGSAGSEAALQNAIIKCCVSNGWDIFWGSMAHRTFRTKGEPDFHIYLSRGKNLIVECKSRKGKLTPEQMGIKMKLEGNGHTVHVVRSLSEFLTLVHRTLNPEKL